MRQYQLAIVEDEPHTARYIQGIVEATNLFHIAAVCESAEELLTLEHGHDKFRRLHLPELAFAHEADDEDERQIEDHGAREGYQHCKTSLSR